MKLEKAQRHWLKIIAIFFAVSLWFYVLNSEPVEIEKKIQIEFIVPKGYGISNLVERQLTIKLKGSKAFIGSIFTNKEKVVIDLNPFLKKFGKNFKVKYHHSLVSIPFGVDILEMTPKDAWVEIDKLVQVELPVRIQYIGTMSADKRFVEEGMEPKVILVSGPIDVMRNVSRVNTYPVNLSSIEHTGQDSIELNLEDIDSRLKFEVAPTVKVKYRIDEVNKDKKK